MSYCGESAVFWQVERFPEQTTGIYCDYLKSLYIYIHIFLCHLLLMNWSSANGIADATTKVISIFSFYCY